MYKQVIVCDKCGKIINEDVAEFSGMHFCKECAPSVADMIRKMLEPVQSGEQDPAEPKKKKPAAKKVARKRTPIDWDKACALKLAGWSNKQIAEEVKTTPGTIGAMIGGKLADYKFKRGMDNGEN